MEVVGLSPLCLEDFERDLARVAAVNPAEDGCIGWADLRLLCHLNGLSLVATSSYQLFGKAVAPGSPNALSPMPSSMPSYHRTLWGQSASRWPR